MECLARILITSMFLYASISNAFKATRIKDLMTSKNIPFVELLFPFSLILMLCSSLAIIFNFYTFFAASYLIFFMMIASYYFADFWTSKGIDRDMKLNQFTLNLTVIGGLLLLAIRYF